MFLLKDDSVAINARSMLSVDFSGRFHAPGGSVLSPKKRKGRLFLICALCLLWTGALVARLYSLQFSDVTRWQKWADKQQILEIKIASERGPIFDRNGKKLAVSVPAGSVYARPSQVKDKKAAAKQLAKLVDRPVSQIEQKLNDKSPFVWIRRQMPRATADKVAALNIPGINYFIESRRYYPFNDSAATLLGKVGIDGNGLSGLEGAYEKTLQGGEVKTRVTRDALGKVISASTMTDDGFEVPKGKPLTLTLDSDVQMIMDEELAAGRKDANAHAAMALMIDADTGEILGMSQAPGVNLNGENVDPKRDLKNLIVESVFEPGSIMKPIVASAAIDYGVMKPTDIINCEHGRFLFAGHTIKDVHPNDSIPLHDVVVRSSNIGMTKVGMKLGAERVYEALKRFGFGQPSGLKFSGESPGILRDVSTWAKIDVATHSFGQGVAVTPIQMVRAISAIANGGKLPELRIVDKAGENFVSHRIITESTAQKVRSMLYGVVEDEHGTGKMAAINGVRIGGKTGTAQKSRPGGKGYQAGAYVASFVGFADATPIGLHKTITLMVAIDEPHGGTIYGGALAAPVFKKIMQRSLQLLATRNELNPDLSDKDEAPKQPSIAPGHPSDLTPVVYHP
jgi:cell division protein FtsI (penicillin-binding protein 3)